MIIGSAADCECISHQQVRRQWQKPRTKVKSLIKLGVSERLTISCASGFIKSTSKGPCRSSKTKGINSAISNAFLARQGLQSLKDLWINIHYSS